MVVMFFALADGDHAAVRDFAFGVFELNGGVDNVKAVIQAFFYVFQDAFAR